MIIVADSGATKTDWRIIHNDKSTRSFYTKGLNPFFCNENDYYTALEESFPNDLRRGDIDKVFFYGAGCAGEERGAKAQNSIKRFFINADTYAFSDLLAAARSLFGKEKGVIAILGTGSNIAYFNGSTIHHYTPSLGYVLGDEGSGAYIGRKLLRAYFYNRLSKDISEAMISKHNLDLPFVLDNIYIQAKPSTYLASFVPFVLENIADKTIFEIVKSSFKELYIEHLIQIPELKQYGLGVIGSVGFLFKDILQEVANEYNFRLVHTLQYPIDDLVMYHINCDL